MTLKSYDLIVVGSSFASTFFLKKYLAKASPTAKVLVLERGYFYPHAERLKEKRGETTLYAKLNENPQDTYINKNPQKEWTFQTSFGGNSNCWVGCTPRFLPNDFKLKSLYGVGNDWPLQYEDIAPYYSEVEEIMSISGPEDTPFPRKGPYPLPPHQFTTVDKVLHQKYGNQYISQPTARASRPTNSRGTCCVSSFCQSCPANAKFTIENSGLNVYEDERVELIYGANVLSLDLAHDVVRKLNYLKDGKEYMVSGEVFALGANAIFNAFILLNSGDKNPYLGKGIGEQVGMLTTVYLDNFANLGGSTYVTANGYMLYDGPHRKDHAACIIESKNAPYIRFEKDKWRNLVQFRMVFEDLPDLGNQVRVSPNLNKPEIYHKGTSEYVLKGIERMKDKLPEILADLPVEGIKHSDPLPTESHILGTTRMSGNAEEGVIDKHLIHHTYRNLFVLGSGSFTTYSPANPTLTLSALSLFAADKSF